MFAVCFKKVEDNMEERIIEIFETKLLPMIQKLLDEKVVKPEDVTVETV
jgi:hypothetical protein